MNDLRNYVGAGETASRSRHNFPIAASLDDDFIIVQTVLTAEGSDRGLITNFCPVRINMTQSVETSAVALLTDANSEATARCRIHRPRPLPDLAKLPDAACLTRGQLCALANVSLATAKLWARTGRGPRFVRIEGRPRYLAGDVRAWLQASEAA